MAGSGREWMDKGLICMRWYLAWGVFLITGFYVGFGLGVMVQIYFYEMQGWGR